MAFVSAGPAVVRHWKLYPDLPCRCLRHRSFRALVSSHSCNLQSLPTLYQEPNPQIVECNIWFQWQGTLISRWPQVGIIHFVFEELIQVWKEKGTGRWEECAKLVTIIIQLYCQLQLLFSWLSQCQEELEISTSQVWAFVWIDVSKPLNWDKPLNWCKRLNWCSPLSNILSVWFWSKQCQHSVLC